jgi:hypothetical protein
MGQPVPVRTYARITAILFLLSFVFGGFGEAYVPSAVIVGSNAAATAKNIVAGAWLIRLGFAGYMVEALCDTALTWTLYVLLRPAHRELAILAVCLRIIATAGFAMAEVLFFGVTRVLGGAAYLDTFSPDQLNTLALLLIKVSVVGQELFSAFYGAGLVVVGYLIVRSGFLPWVLGALLGVGGLGFMFKTFAFMMAPRLASPILLAPVAVGGLGLTIWLLVKGVDVPKWQESAAAADHRSA